MCCQRKHAVELHRENLEEYFHGFPLTSSHVQYELRWLEVEVNQEPLGPGARYQRCGIG